MRTSTSQPCSLAPHAHACDIEPIAAAARDGSMLRASPSTRQRLGTTFVAVPPSILPTFAVVSSSRRPSSIAAIAAAAAAIEL
jgi:hypothetical protein